MQRNVLSRPSIIMTLSDPNAFALLTPDEMGQADRAALVAAPDQDLMDHAGRAVAGAIAVRWSKRAVLVLAGPGNNGGDGFVAARYLAAGGWPVRIALLGERTALAGDAARHAELWTGPVEPLSVSALEGAKLVIDALFGAGLSRPLDGLAKTVVEALAARGLPICAVDVPSGLDGASGEARGAVAAADLTVTFFRKKPGHLLLPGRSLCGELVLSDIGIPASVIAAIAPKTFENDPDLWLARYPWPTVAGYKYTRGHALVLGGEATTGASRLTARAAQRAGAGLVTVAAPRAVWPIYATALLSEMVHAIEGPSDFEALLADERRNAIAIGPGAGVSKATRRAVLSALKTRRAVVLDADALTAFAEQKETLFDAIDGPCVLTPHDGEFKRLFDPAGDKLTRVRRAAELSGAVVLLKGADTVIAAPDGRAVINANAPPQLATGGSGDVLTGLITGLLAQGMTAFDAAAAGAWLHGAAAADFGLGLIAEDLPERLPRVIQHLAVRTAPQNRADKGANQVLLKLN
jgi:NAD(P)H-hydrate epimerase